MNRSLSELALRAAAGERDAFDALHARLAPGLRRLFLDRTRGNADAAEDLAQRTWLACWRAVQERKFDPGRAAFSTYLYAIGTNLWREYLRAQKRSADDEGLADWTTPHPDPERSAEIIDAVRACLRGEGGGMTEEERLVLRVAAEGGTDREIASRLGVAASTINARRRLALDKLRVFLQTRGFAERPGASSQERDEPVQRGTT